MTTTKLAARLALLLVSACADENPTLPDGGGGTGEYKQMEQLARPGINEAFLLTNDFNAGYNATAPSFAGAPAEAVAAISAEAKTVMKALYLGACLLNGALGLDANSGVKPAGIICHAVGPAIWTENSLTGVTLTESSNAAAQAYADKVFGQFIPDVMRIDTSVQSGYLTTCDGTNLNAVPLLCGGRKLNEDVIDMTFHYLLAGAALKKGGLEESAYQFRALVSDGVNFSATDSQNAGNLLAPDVDNPNQFHEPISTDFPYSAAPF